MGKKDNKHPGVDWIGERISPFEGDLEDAVESSQVHSDNLDFPKPTRSQYKRDTVVGKDPTYGSADYEFIERRPQQKEANEIQTYQEKQARVLINEVSKTKPDWGRVNRIYQRIEKGLSSGKAVFSEPNVNNPFMYDIGSLVLQKGTPMATISLDYQRGSGKLIGYNIKPKA